MSEALRKTQAGLADREQKQKLWGTLPFVVVGLLAAVGVGWIVYGYTQTTSSTSGVNGPRLQVDRELIDLGDQYFNTTARATFNITNTGDGALNLTVPKMATVVEGC